jgi:hypothetical protein
MTRSDRAAVSAATSNHSEQGHTLSGRLTDKQVRELTVELRDWLVEQKIAARWVNLCDHYLSLARNEQHTKEGE